MVVAISLARAGLCVGSGLVRVPIWRAVSACLSSLRSKQNRVSRSMWVVGIGEDSRACAAPQTVQGGKGRLRPALGNASFLPVSLAAPAPVASVNHALRDMYAPAARTFGQGDCGLCGRSCRSVQGGRAGSSRPKVARRASPLAGAVSILTDCPRRVPGDPLRPRGCRLRRGLWSCLRALALPVPLSCGLCAASADQSRAGRVEPTEGRPKGKPACGRSLDPD